MDRRSNIRRQRLIESRLSENNNRNFHSSQHISNENQKSADSSIWENLSAIKHDSVNLSVQSLKAEPILRAEPEPINSQYQVSKQKFTTFDTISKIGLGMVSAILLHYGTMFFLDVNNKTENISNDKTNADSSWMEKPEIQKYDFKCSAADEFRNLFSTIVDNVQTSRTPLVALSIDKSADKSIDKSNDKSINKVKQYSTNKKRVIMSAANIQANMVKIIWFLEKEPLLIQLMPLEIVCSEIVNIVSGRVPLLTIPQKLLTENICIATLEFMKTNSVVFEPDCNNISHIPLLLRTHRVLQHVSPKEFLIHLTEEERTPCIWKLLLECDGMLLQFLPERKMSYELCRAAFSQNSAARKFVPSAYKKFI